MHKALSLPIIMCTTLALLSGCQVVSVKQQKLGTTLSNERDSILTRNKLSEASLNMLSMTGRQSESCIRQPYECLQDLRQIPEILDEQLLSSGSEIFLAHGLQLGSSSQCTVRKFKEKEPEKEAAIQQEYKNCINAQLEAFNESIRYSYAYLFATNRPAEQRLFDNRQVQVRDFYNQTITNLVTLFNVHGEHPSSYNDQSFEIGNSQYQIDLKEYENLPPDHVEKLISTYNLSFSGLRSISRRDGFGSEFAIQLKENKIKAFDKYLSNPFLSPAEFKNHPNIHQARFLPATIVIEPENKTSIDAILASKEFNLRVIDPNRYQNIKIASKQTPLAANFSAPYGLWLANNNLGAAAYWSLIDREQDLMMPHLFMLEPYNPNKKVVIMIHGLASSPEAWIAMTNDIMGDHILRDNFQVWQIFYSTNMPILESRYQIYALIKQNFDYISSQNPKNPPQHAVLLGHSMGGVIARLLVSNDDFTPQVLEHLQKKDENRYERVRKLDAAQARLKMNSLTPPIDRAIFVSAPLRGTDYADRWFTLAARKIIKLPQSFLTATLDTISHSLSGDITADFFKQFGKDLLQNGPSDLSKKSTFMKITGNASISPKIKYHVIIGNNTNSTDADTMTDGIVPYKSAHLDAAQSEAIIKGGHSIQYSPEAVLELRRILRLHLTELGINK